MFENLAVGKRSCSVRQLWQTRNGKEGVASEAISSGNAMPIFKLSGELVQQIIDSYGQIRKLNLSTNGKSSHFPREIRVQYSQPYLDDGV